MILGIPKETKRHEYRVSMTPIAVRDMVRAGHTILVERSAGAGSGWGDKEYRDAGARIVSAEEIFSKSEMIVKVKEPQVSEIPRLQPGQILFTFLHLAGYPSLIKALLRRKIIGIGYETVQLEDGSLPLLAPMSEIAGKLAAIMGANYLRKDFGGKGKLLSGVLGKDRGHVTVIGAGNAGAHAAVTAHGLGANVTVFDLDKAKLEALRRKIPDRLEMIPSSPPAIREVIVKTDLVVGAVLIAGRRAPRVVTKEMIERMTPGSVIVDIAIDQGGCVEGIRVTSHAQPIYIRQGVIHNAVDNMPSLVPRSASEALSRATFPYVKKIADVGYKRAIHEDRALAKGLNLDCGEILLESLRNDLKKLA